MTWRTSTVVISPTALDDLCAARKAVLGPGPGGVTLTTSYLGKELTAKYRITGITHEEGVAGIRLTRRWWEY